MKDSQYTEHVVDHLSVERLVHFLDMGDNVFPFSERIGWYSRVACFFLRLWVCIVQITSCVAQLSTTFPPWNTNLRARHLLNPWEGMLAHDEVSIGNFGLY